MEANIADLMPFSRLIGVKVEYASADCVRGGLVVRGELCTTGGIIHGGAIVAFADTLGAIGAHYALPAAVSGTITIESKTNFLGSARVGEKISGEAYPFKTSNRLSVWQTEIIGEQNQSLALVIQTQLVMD